MIRITSPDQIGPVLADLRAMHGYTQRALAAESGIWQGRVSAYERSEDVPTARSLLAILGVLGLGLAIVPVDETTVVDARWERLIETLAHPIRLTVREETADAPSAPVVTPQTVENGPGVVGYGSEASSGPTGLSGGEWNWTPTADGGSYSGPHGPDICPAIGCQHGEGRA